jgi:predicted XRE-type DNA-binding protein
MTVTGKTFATAWDAIAETPAEAVILKARADLMIALTDHIKAQGCNAFGDG